MNIFWGLFLAEEAASEISGILVTLAIQKKKKKKFFNYFHSDLVMVEGAFQICNALSHSTDLHVLTTQANIQSTSTMKSRKSSAKKSWMVLNFLVSLHKH